PGGKKRGRCVSPRPLPMRIAGSFADRIRPSTMMQSFNYDDLADHHAAARPWPVLLRFGPRALWNKLTGRRSMGGALIAGLVRGCLDHGVEIRLEAPALGLIVEHGRVVGARVAAPGGSETIRARRGVLLATGGFEWNPELMARYLPGPVELTASPSTNTGDGQRMAEAVGAELAHMDQALIHPVKETTYEGRQAGAPSSDLKLPHIMLVNLHGKRFVNEVQVNIGLAFAERDPATGYPVNLPAWRIFDRQYARKYPRVLPMSRKPPGFYTAGSLAGLARLIGVDPAGLEESARRMNAFARAGRDDDFGRGSHCWDVTTIGDPKHRPCPVLGTIEEPPFHAIPYHAAYLGTKGGARTNEHGQVLRPDGSRIAGLYAAGNAMANPIGSKAVGAGTTIGPCLTWGYVCGLSMLRENA
ncbi:MAG: FAD-binding protein, partial [Alphaproteobacteria bacterium]|nr:FAD-binding protein [Alphaproteobacteria bacterium]